MTIKPEHIRKERDGKEYILYAGLLNEAHERGLKSIATTLVQIPHETNGNVAIVCATVETAQGTFSGIGDASPANVNRMMALHTIRMAETRAKARALRDAVNIGMAAYEELAGHDDQVDRDDRPPPKPKLKEPSWPKPAMTASELAQTPEGRATRAQQWYAANQAVAARAGYERVTFAADAPPDYVLEEANKMRAFLRGALEGQPA